MKTSAIIKTMSRAGVLLSLGLLAGCAGVTIHDSAGNKTSIPVRLPETYLLVSPSADDPTQDLVQVVSLPTGQQLLLTPKPGFGSASLEFTLANGALASWGSAQDSKVAETITAVTGALTALRKDDEEKKLAAKQPRQARLYRVKVEDNGSGGSRVTLQEVPLPWNQGG